MLYRIVHEEPDLQPLRELDAELADVVAACLDKDHEGRPTAAELVETAQRHGTFTEPLWPEAVNGPLAERAAFASTVPEPGEPPEPQEREPSLLGRGPGRTARPARAAWPYQGPGVRDPGRRHRDDARRHLAAVRDGRRGPGRERGRTAHGDRFRGPGPRGLRHRHVRPERFRFRQSRGRGEGEGGQGRGRREGRG
ncbi:hypothetical protein R2F25_16345 [Streptomyces sp. UP1A-1]|nr:hypothetical protein [Streptomyces sp. UP1A-1]